MRNIRSVAAVAVMVAALPLLSACGGSPGDPSASARGLADAPGWVRTPTGTDCGSVEIGHRRELPEENLQCLEDAGTAGNVGMLTWISRTTEGDPIPSSVITTGPCATVASTSTYDTYGDGGWTEYRCMELTALPDC